MRIKYTACFFVRLKCCVKSSRCRSVEQGQRVPAEGWTQLGLQSVPVEGVGGEVPPTATPTARMKVFLRLYFKPSPFRNSRLFCLILQTITETAQEWPWEWLSLRTYGGGNQELCVCCRGEMFWCMDEWKTSCVWLGEQQEIFFQTMQFYF